jgi:acetylornithine deacetylase
MTIPRGDAVALLRQLVRIDSRNPTLVPGAPGERPVAEFLARILRDWGMDVEMHEVLDGRANVVARVGGRGRHAARSLMFNGHLDVVGVEAMRHSPFGANELDGALFGRGASDMKGGVAAMCAAAARLVGTIDGDLVVAAVIDEEWKSAGTAALLASGVRTDAAIVTEPTQLSIMPAHRGFVWIEARFLGHAAHGSRWDLGVDAIRHAGLLLAELDTLDSSELAKRQHRLLGRPSLHASSIEGGLGMSTYPDRCVLRIERRTIPGETVEQVMREVGEVCESVAGRDPKFRCEVELLFAQPPSDVDLEAPVMAALRETLVSRGMSAEPQGMSAWTDAALLNAAGIPAVCFGPGDMGLAHAAEEYIQLDEVSRAADILEDFARSWCN